MVAGLTSRASLRFLGCIRSAGIFEPSTAEVFIGCEDVVLSAISALACSC